MANDAFLNPQPAIIPPSNLRWQWARNAWLLWALALLILSSLLFSRLARFADFDQQNH